MIYQKLKGPVYLSIKTLVLMSSMGIFISACGEKKKSGSQANTADLCAEDKTSSPTVKKATASKKADPQEEEVEEEVEPKKTTTKSKKLAFSLQTSTGTSTSTTSGGVTYEKDIKSFWVPGCVTGCHTSTGSVPHLETWAEISAGAKAGVESTKTSRMPIGTASLTAAQKQLLLDWEAGGFLQGMLPTPPTPPTPPTTGSTGTKTSTDTSVTQEPTPTVEETAGEDAGEEEKEEKSPKAVKKSTKASAVAPESCVTTKKAETSTKKATSKTTTTKTKKATAKDEVE